MARRKLRNLDNRILRKVVAHGAALGIDEISTKKIAEEIGITEPTIYVHFQTRVNLLFSANEFAIKELLSGFGNDDATLLQRWGSALESAKNNPLSALYAYYYRQTGRSLDYDKIFSAFLRDDDPLKASILQHYLYQAAVGSLELSEENVKKTFDIISNL